MDESSAATGRRTRAVALSASLRGVVDEGLLDSHLRHFLAGGAETEFLGELIKSGVVDTDAVELLLSEPVRTTVTDPLKARGARASLVVPLIGIDSEAFANINDNAGEGPDDDGVDSADFAKISLLDSQGVGGVQATESNSVPRRRERTAVPPPPDFDVVRTLGRGGMGEVLEVQDRVLWRHAALKRIRADKRDPLAERMFLQEAQITAQLEHPNIPPIHRYGTLSTGEPWFTMKRVQGTTLRARLRQRARGEGQGQGQGQGGQHDLVGLVLVFLQVLQAVSHAHARGVVHCDLKPENVLLGAHGEVLVMDWGLAVPITPRVGDRLHLTAEVIAHTSGTPLYMSPEQLVGDVVDARADVFALGVILHEILTGTLPWGEHLQPAELLVRMFTTDLRRPRDVVGASVAAFVHEIDDEIEEICLRALSPRAEERFDDGEAMRLAVQAWLTDAQKRRLAGEKFAEGERAWATVVAARAERVLVEQRRRQLAATIPAWAPPTAKRPLWDTEDQLFQLDTTIDQGIADADDAWSRATGIDATFVEASDRLADLHAELFVLAEQTGDRRALLLHRRGVERHHRGRHRALLAGTGRVIVTVPPGATMSAVRLVEQGRVIVPGDAIFLPAPRGAGGDGSTGGRVDVTVPMGSVRFTLRAPGMRDTILPVLVERGATVELSPRLMSNDDLGSDAVFIPAGPCVCGGDPHALNALPRAVVHVDDVVMAKHPVTCAGYVAFLNALEHERPGSAARHVPRTRPDGGYLWPRGDDGVYVLPFTDADGNPVLPHAPVMGVSFDDAVAYAGWRRRASGLPWRLPTEHEWEKAARGADGRVFPWGNGFDETFCKMALSRPGRPQPEPVGSFPTDTSVYGVQDMAGAIREWTSSFYDDAKETRVLRGGAWYFNAAYCRLAFRHGYLPHIVFTNFGIRLCRTP